MRPWHLLASDSAVRISSLSRCRSSFAARYASSNSLASLRARAMSMLTLPCWSVSVAISSRMTLRSLSVLRSSFARSAARSVSYCLIVLSRRFLSAVKSRCWFCRDSGESSQSCAQRRVDSDGAPCAPSARPPCP